MITRVVIRVKVLQAVYASGQRNDKDLASAEQELLSELEKAYDLYHYLLSLIVVLTGAEQKRIDRNKHKMLATEDELNPNRRMADNRFAGQLRSNCALTAFTIRKGAFWDNGETRIIPNLLNKILRSTYYENYLNGEDSYEADRDFWKKIFRHIILEDAELAEMLEDECIYWVDDLNATGSFVLKTIGMFYPEAGAKEELLPMYKTDADREYAIKLLRHTLLEEEENTRRINSRISNWDIERIAQMDLYIMQIAISELRNFPDIPVNVTLNEYINLSRYYSTPNSPNFINGILDSIAKDMENEGKLSKDEHALSQPIKEHHDNNLSTSNQL
jgi:N utilization substance protein B